MRRWIQSGANRLQEPRIRSKPGSGLDAANHPGVLGAYPGYNG